MDSCLDRFIKNFKKIKIGKKTILDWSYHLATKDSKAFEVQHTGTLFKLDLLYSYLDFPYLHIMSRQRQKYNTKLIFLDLYSGNGLNKIKSESSLFLCGSSLLALLCSHNQTIKKQYPCYFDYTVMIDNDKDSITTLYDRCDALTKDLKISNKLKLSNKFETDAQLLTIRGDVINQDFISQLCLWLDSIWQDKIHIMMFVDPGSPGRLSMQTLTNLLTYPGDLIILLHQELFVEMVLKKRYNTDTIQRMLGMNKTDAESLFNKSKAELSRLYVKRFVDTIQGVKIDRLSSGSNYRNVVSSIKIRTDKQTYTLLFATRTTGGKHHETWQKIFSDYNTCIEKLSDAGKTMIGVLKGSQQRVDMY